MSKPRLLDLFCGAGGCSVGYARAGFEVIGIDIEPHPEYPFEFWQADALEVLRDLPRAFHELDAIHASPPCQVFSSMGVMPNARQHEDLLTPCRELLREIGIPYVIENVVGAPIEVRPPSMFEDHMGVMLCGSMFNLNDGTYELRRHRLFETSFPVEQPLCQHHLPVVGFYGDHARTRQRTVAGHRDRGGDITGAAEKLRLARDLMGIDWMKWHDVSQAIPPAYTEFIGEQLLSLVGSVPLTEGGEG